jgi:hypothetical protein
MKRLSILALALAMQAGVAFADATPAPTRLDARLLTMSGNTCANPEIPRGAGMENFVGDSLLPNFAMGVYDALTAALDDAGRDKERVSVAVLNLSDGQPACFQVALRPDAWRSQMGREDAEGLRLSGLATTAQITDFPFLAEFYIRRRGSAIAIGASVLRYHEPIWRNFQSPANELVATFVISAPNQEKSQTVSVPLGGPTRREEGGYRLFDILNPGSPENSRAVRSSPQTPWFTTPFSSSAGAAPVGGGQAAPPQQNPVTITIQLRELKNGNPVAALLAGVLRDSRTAAAAEASPAARAQARAAEMTADVAAINAYGTALGAYHTARATYCANGAGGGAPTAQELQTRNPAPLWAAHQVLLEYAQRGIGSAPPFPMVDLGNPSTRVCTG